MASCTKHISCDPGVQAIRAVDVFLLGPAMVLVGRRHGGIVGSFVAVLGGATIAFNGVRLVRGEQKRALSGDVCEEQIDCRKGTQAVRLVDVFLLGPAMIHAGSKQKGLIGLFVAASGFACSAWNAKRFLEARSKRRLETWIKEIGG